MPYFLQHELAFTMNEMARATDVDVRRSFTDSLVSVLGEIFKVTSIAIFSTLMDEAAAEQVKIVVDTKLQLMFEQSGYLMEGYIPTILDVDFNKGLIGEAVKICSFGSSGD